MSAGTPFSPDNPLTGVQSPPDSLIQTTVFEEVEDEEFYTDQEAQYEEVSNPGAIWEYYTIVNRYERDRHTYMLGLTSQNGFNGESVAIVQLATPTVLWIADWSASRCGLPPTIPNPNQDASQWVLIDDIIETRNVYPKGDGNTPVYTISGMYVYACKIPPSGTFDYANFPRPPWYDTQEVPRNVSTGMYEQNLINNQDALTPPGTPPRGNPDSPLPPGIES